MKQAACVSFALFVLAVLPLAADPPAETTETTETTAQSQALSLAELVKDAMRANLSLQSARASTRSLETGVLAARGTFDPLLQATPSYSRGNTSLLLEPDVTASGTQSGKTLSMGVSGTLPFSTAYQVALDHGWQNQDNSLIATPGQQQPSANTSLTLTLRQPVLKGAGPTYAGAPVRIASLAALSAGERLNWTVEQTVASVESAYWSLGLAEAIERLSRDSSLRAEGLLSRNQKMRSLALISDVDFITSKRGLQSRLTSLTEATRRRLDSFDQLLFFVYADQAVEKLERFASLRTEPPPTSAPVTPAPAELDAVALGQRSDLKAFRLDVTQGAFVERVAYNALLPDVSFTGSLTAQTLATDTFRLYSTNRTGDMQGSYWKLGVTLSYPLSNSVARAAYQKSSWDARTRTLALASAETSVRSEVRAASRAVTTNGQRLLQAQLGFDLARQQYEAGQKQLQLGLIDSFRLLQMEDDVTNAELTLVQVRYDLAQAITSYELATGTLRKKYGAVEEETGGTP